jgi:hypothetical protein
MLSVPSGPGSHPPPPPPPLPPRPTVYWLARHHGMLRTADKEGWAWGKLPEQCHKIIWTGHTLWQGLNNVNFLARHEMDGERKMHDK